MTGVGGIAAAAVSAGGSVWYESRGGRCALAENRGGEHEK